MYPFAQQGSNWSSSNPNSSILILIYYKSSIFFMLKIALVQFNRNQERSHIFDRWVFGSADMNVPLISNPTPLNGRCWWRRCCRPQSAGDNHWGGLASRHIYLNDWTIKGFSKASTAKRALKVMIVWRFSLPIPVQVLSLIIPYQWSNMLFMELFRLYFSLSWNNWAV